MLKRIFFFALYLFGCCFLTFASNRGALVKFTENKGQWDSNILFRAQLDGGVLFLEKNCFTYSFYEKEKLGKNHIRPADYNPTKEEQQIRTHAFRVTLKNALPQQSVRPDKRSTTYSNFFIGNNPQRWASHAYDYERVYYKNIYTGIDLEVNGRENSMKYNFIVQPGADASKICLSYFGVKKITNENGSLRIETPLTTIIESKPYAYQEINGTHVPVACHFVINNNEVTFSLPENYRADIPLIIDPTLIFSSYSGSFANNFGMTATFDNFGNLYAGGTAFGHLYPTTPAAFDTSFNGTVYSTAEGRTDVVISKYDSSGRNLLYSTYLGGDTSTEVVTSLIVNSNNELMLFGMTGSFDFPVTPNAYDTTFNGGSFVHYGANGTKFASGTDIYLAKFSADGSQLLASTFVGGSANDGVNSSGILTPNYGDQFRGEIQTDTAGNFYAASCTYSTNFPVTPAAFQQTPGGQLDGCVFKMSPDVSQMLWCSYLGGTSDDASFALILDTNQNVYATGGTVGGGFPTTPTAVNDTFIGGTADAFVTKIKADGTTILSSTFLGTNLFDLSYFIQADTLEHIYVFGQSQGDMPVIGNVYSNPGSKQFVTILSSGLDTILYSTVLGNGSSAIQLSPAAFLVDRCGNIYISGWGGNLGGGGMFNMPLTSDAYQPEANNVDGHNFYFAVYGPYLQVFEYGTYFGGNQSQEHVDGGTSRFDPKGILYQSVCAGCQNHDDFPTFPDTVWSHVNNSTGCNNGVVKIDMNVQNTEARFTAFPKMACPYVDVTFTNQSIAGYNFYWNFGDGSPVSNSVHATHAYNAGGTYIVSLIASSPFCGIDTAFDTIYVYTPPVAAFGHSGLYCNAVNDVQFNNTSVNADSSFWRFGDNDTSTAVSPSHTYPSPGNYTVSLIVVDTVGCSDTIQHSVTIFADPSAAFIYSLTPCILDVSFAGTPVPGVTYDWDFGDATSGNGQGISHTYSQEGSYNVMLQLTDGNGCEDTVTQTVSPFTSSLAEFTYNVDSCSLMTVFVNQSKNLAFNYWDLGDNTLTSVINPAHSYSVRGSYMVTLIINQGTICADTIVKNLVLDEGNFADYFIPNIFTPNGDSYNARFTIKGFDFCNEFLVKVYNRWGELLFESTDILDPWDGTFKGKDVPEGVYFYIVKGSKVNRNGTVTVKRN